MLAKMAEVDRLAYIEKMRKEKEEKDREELTRRLQAEEEARKAMDFARKQAILKAQLVRTLFLQSLIFFSLTRKGLCYIYNVFNFKIYLQVISK